MKNQVAEKIFDRWHNSYRDPQVIGHPGKRKAVREALDKKWEWLHHIKDELNNDSDRLEYIGTLPFMGPITKYHLARNIGLDVAKPDRHLTRLAGKYGFPGVQEMCRYISERTSERIGAVDVILWRYCNMHPKLFSGTGEYPEAVI